MAVIRVKKTHDYTVMCNYHLSDLSLSLKARGLLSTMLMLPDDWDYSILGLAQICKDGKASVQSALKELQDAGYVRIMQTRADGGKFLCAEYTIYESPAAAKAAADAEKDDAISPYAGNRDTAPYPEKRDTENRDADTLFNKQNTNIYPLKEPPKAARRENGTKSAPSWEPERFQGFWNFYPKAARKDKRKAILEWDKLRPSPELIDTIGRALKLQKATEEWQAGIGIPYPCRYLRNRRWEDVDNGPDDPAPKEEGGYERWT